MLTFAHDDKKSWLNPFFHSPPTQPFFSCSFAIQIINIKNDDLTTNVELFQELETLANEQDRETDKIALLKDAEKHHSQLAR